MANINFDPLSQNVDGAMIKAFVEKTGKRQLILTDRTVAIISGLAFVFGATSFLIKSGCLISCSTIELMTSIYLIIAPLAAAPVLLAIRRYQNEYFAKIIRLSDFASKNGMEFQEQCTWQSYPGMIFNHGRNQKMYDRLISKNSANYFEISNYSFKTSNGKEETTVSYAYIMVKLDRNIPQMVLDSKMNNARFLGMNISNLPISFNKEQVLSLEGDFDKHFTLYAPKEYKRDALYVFTPDLMALFIDESGDFDAEIIDDKLFIYSSKPFDLLNVDLVKRIFSIINNVGSKTDSRTDRYADERVGDKAMNVVAQPGQRLKKRFPTIVVLIIIMVLAVQCFVAANIFINLSPR